LPHTNVQAAAEDETRAAIARQDASAAQAAAETKTAADSPAQPSGVYEGDSREGRAHGRGKYVSAKGTYEGEFKKGFMHGRGKFVWANGTAYEGDWSEDHLHGRGVVTFAVDGKTSLPGCDYCCNAGDKYDGGFKADVRHGACSYTFFNGETLNCTWAEGHCPEFVARQAAILASYSSCCSILESLNQGKLASEFRRQCITDDVMHALTKDDLGKLGLPMGKAVQFIAAVQAKAAAAGGGSGVAAVASGMSKLSTFTPHHAVIEKPHEAAAGSAAGSSTPPIEYENSHAASPFAHAAAGVASAVPAEKFKILLIGDSGASKLRPLRLATSRVCPHPRLSPRRWQVLLAPAFRRRHLHRKPHWYNRFAPPPFISTILLTPPRPSGIDFRIRTVELDGETLQLQVP